MDYSPKIISIKRSAMIRKNVWTVCVARASLLINCTWLYRHRRISCMIACLYVFIISCDRYLDRWVYEHKRYARLLYFVIAFLTSPFILHFKLSVQVCILLREPTTKILSYIAMNLNIHNNKNIHQSKCKTIKNLNFLSAWFLNAAVKATSG